MACAITDLQPIYRGDTVPLDFEFTNPDGDPVNIADTTLELVFTVDPTIYNAELNDLIVTTVFPDDVNSQKGLGALDLLPAHTEQLKVNTNYHYYFRWYQDPTLPFTLGSGRVLILQNTIIP